MRSLILLAMAGASLNAQIIFDTDSGFFGDDGVALTMLLRSPRRPDVKGVTVVSGNVWAPEGAAFMSRNVKLLGLPKLPVLVGSEVPLVHSAAMWKTESGIAYGGAFETPRPAAAASHGGVDFLIRTIDASPGKVSVLAIGPLTNLALALRRRPDIAPKIGALVMMGGAVGVPGNSSATAEFNFWFDPEAAQAVFRSAIPNKVLFALDLCNQFHFSKELFDQVTAHPSPITALYREDFGNRYPGFLKDPKAVGSLWDELAAAWVIDPSLVTRSESLYLDVDSTFGPNYGAVRPLDRVFAPHATPVRHVLGMNFDKVLALYREALTAK